MKNQKMSLKIQARKLNNNKKKSSKQNKIKSKVKIIKMLKQVF